LSKILGTPEPSGILFGGGRKKNRNKNLLVKKFLTRLFFHPEISLAGEV
jgi:hypothetical protein